jgi:hypothetical protein
MYNKRSYSKLITKVSRMAGPKADIAIESVHNYYKFTNAKGAADLSSQMTLAEAYAWFSGWVAGRNHNEYAQFNPPASQNTNPSTLPK